jgi:hypothetical protein
VWQDERLHHWTFYLFREKTMTNHSYLIMSELYTVPQLLCIAWFQQDGVHPHFVNIICQFLNGHFMSRWIGKAENSIAFNIT